MIRRETRERKDAAKLYAWICVGCDSKCMVICENPDKPQICVYEKAVPDFFLQRKK